MVMLLLVSATVMAARAGVRLAVSTAAPVYFRRTSGPEIGKVERLDEVCLPALQPEATIRRACLLLATHAANPLPS